MRSYLSRLDWKKLSCATCQNRCLSPMLHVSQLLLQLCTLLLLPVPKLGMKGKVNDQEVAQSATIVQEEVISLETTPCRDERYQQRLKGEQDLVDHHR